MSETRRLPEKTVAAVAVVIGEKIHWIHDPIRAEDLARIVLRTTLDAGEVALINEHDAELARLRAIEQAAQAVINAGWWEQSHAGRALRAALAAQDEPKAP